MAKRKKDHVVQILMHGSRYIALERDGVITLSKDGTELGKAWWRSDQLLDSSAILPDDVTATLEKKLKERIDNNWDED